jgi:hypothetical protein
MFNVTYVAGVGLSAAFMPADGHSPAIVGVVAAGYVILAAGYWLASGRGQASPSFARSGGGTGIPSSAAQRSSS